MSAWYADLGGKIAVMYVGWRRVVTWRPPTEYTYIYIYGPDASTLYHDDVIKWKHFPRYWPFVRGIHRSPVDSTHKGQRRGDLMFSLICARMNGWINNREAGDSSRYRAHYDVTVMVLVFFFNRNINM